jgi:hypothetical protein
MIFRIYYQQRGGHTHMRFFAGKREGALGKCGDLTMRNEEFAEFRRLSAAAGIIEFRPEET